MYKSQTTCFIHPTHLDHRSPVKGEVNKTHLYTGKIRHSKQIWTQPRLQINLFKIPTTKGHQILQSIIKLKYNKRKSKGHNLHFVLYLPFTHSQVNIILMGCRFILQSYNDFFFFTHRVTDIQHPKTRFNTNKIQLHTGAESHRMEVNQRGASRLISFNFSLQKDTRTGNQA